jgi:serine/threonine protein kinase
MAVNTSGSLLGGRYRVVRVLGAGGMAAVFECQDERLGRSVAVKRLHAHSAEETAQRFAREAKLGASLNHPNLVSIYDTVTDDEAVLIVMELVEGQTLAEALKQGPLPRSRALTVIDDVASALDHAHGHGVVHRDIKPANVLLRQDGVTKLVDLGIATAADQTKITRSGVVLGTAAYMAPEQLEGGETGPATDIYSLAVVAFEALSGRRARSGRTPMEIAHEFATEDGPPNIQDVWAEAPPAAAEALCRGMARDAADRPASAGELARELEEALLGDDTHTTRAAPRSSVPSVSPVMAPREEAPPPETSSGWRAPAITPGRARRGPSLAVFAAVGLLALAFVVALVAILSSGGDGERTAERGGGAGQTQQRDTGGKRNNAKKQKAKQPQAEEQQPQAPAPAPQAQPEAESGTTSGGTGTQLNDQGFRLMKQGRYAEAVPILQRAVASYPDDSQDIQYAYALYNLGVSLNRSGHSKEAIPYLEKRLRWSNQRETVQRELEDARRKAGD